MGPRLAEVTRFGGVSALFLGWQDVYTTKMVAGKKSLAPLAAHPHTQIGLAGRRLAPACRRSQMGDSECCDKPFDITL